jgi:hypothetical protein
VRLQTMRFPDPMNRRGTHPWAPAIDL